ncbi:hypothetical protein SPRG_03318 [Saprolegnia parasitica CBS 223.65]|uniref:Uncharacterized protein n=1 Tax=Saprolegnia parasitica (strain CBS 223.65) TaxID=695850 RepID=A0A067CN23_SAPPC|nr:hypothetical protein SPRG_03318 [Saprolegnia parasitica CBS 223.65]KDO32099.1 hypothetical protein SPRG_03318 [Saprolegnia parasitica CBS 223.65]|eukprot:XP_012197285.1 hypothetical protein SPRG_03318 [Saprolegnia parasitica CBS 223.65]
MFVLGDVEMLQPAQRSCTSQLVENMTSFDCRSTPQIATHPTIPGTSTTRDERGAGGAGGAGVVWIPRPSHLVQDEAKVHLLAHRHVDHVLDVDVDGGGCGRRPSLSYHRRWPRSSSWVRSWSTEA